MFDFLDYWATLPKWILWSIAISLIAFGGYLFQFGELELRRSRSLFSGLLLIFGSVLLFVDDG